MAAAAAAAPVDKPHPASMETKDESPTKQKIGCVFLSLETVVHRSEGAMPPEGFYGPDQQSMIEIALTDASSGQTFRSSMSPGFEHEESVPWSSRIWTTADLSPPATVLTVMMNWLASAYDGPVVFLALSGYSMDYSVLLGHLSKYSVPFSSSIKPILCDVDGLHGMLAHSLESHRRVSCRGILDDFYRTMTDDESYHSNGDTKEQSRRLCTATLSMIGAASRHSYVVRSPLPEVDIASTINYRGMSAITPPMLSITLPGSAISMITEPTRSERMALVVLLYKLAMEMGVAVELRDNRLPLWPLSSASKCDWVTRMVSESLPQTGDVCVRMPLATTTPMRPAAAAAVLGDAMALAFGTAEHVRMNGLLPKPSMPLTTDIDLNITDATLAKLASINIRMSDDLMVLARIHRNRSMVMGAMNAAKLTLVESRAVAELAMALAIAN